MTDQVANDLVATVDAACNDLRRLQKLDTRCAIGPYEPVTLAFLIEDYVVHLKHHLAKIAARVAT